MKPFEEVAMNFTSHQVKRSRERGSTILEMIIVAAIVGIITGYAVMRVTFARDSLRLTNSAQILSGYLEKARLAAIRCHCSSTVQIVDAGNYSVTGNLKDSSSQTLSVPLERNVTFQTQPETITFDWRGRADNDYPIVLVNSQNATITINVRGGGDIKINSTADSTITPTINATNLPTDLAADSYVTNFVNTSTNGTPTPTPTPNPKNHKKPKK
jgi:Tfp pilus assembly protein FimT